MTNDNQKFSFSLKFISWMNLKISVQNGLDNAKNCLVTWLKQTLTNCSCHV